MTLVEGQVVADWVNSRLPYPINLERFEAFGFHRDGVIVSGAVYNNYHPFFVRRQGRWQTNGGTIDITFATAGPGSLTPGAIRAYLWYAFGTPRITRLQAITARDNRPARRLLEKLGFIREGAARRGWDGQRNAILYGLLAHEAERWMGNVEGKFRTAAAA